MRATLVSIAMLCSSVTHAQLGDPEGAEAREGRLEPARAFTSPDKWFKASVPAKPGEVRKAGNSYLVTLDVGAESPIVCEVTPAGIRLADALRRGFDTWLKEAGSGQGQMAVIEATDAGALGDVPFLEIRWRYGPGALKQLVFNKLGHGVYCAHPGLGYVKTFETVTRSLAESFKAPARRGRAVFHRDQDGQRFGHPAGGCGFHAAAKCRRRYPGQTDHRIDNARPRRDTRTRRR